MSTPITDHDLFRLASVLERHALSPDRVNIAATAAIGLPVFAVAGTNTNAVVLAIAPLSSPPTDTSQELYTSENGVAIGVLKAVRALSLSDREIPSLPPDMYLVLVNRGQMTFVNGQGTAFAPPSLKASVRSLEQDVGLPRANITLKDIAYSWHHIQVCSEPALEKSLSATESCKIAGAIQAAVTALAAKEMVDAGDINISGAVSAILQFADGADPANLVIAPPVSFSPSPGDEPLNGVLLGACNVLSPIGVDRRIGPCVLRAAKLQGSEPRVHLEWPDGAFADLPAKEVEVRGKLEGEIDGPLVILGSICIRLCNPFTGRCNGTICF